MAEREDRVPGRDEWRAEKPNDWIGRFYIWGAVVFTRVPPGSGDEDDAYSR
jgi:hypothetical protein